MPTLNAPPALVTAEQLLELDDDRHLELHEGKIVEMTPPEGAHGIDTFRLGFLAGVFIFLHGLGECTATETGFLVATDPDTVLAPDWAFLPKERAWDPDARGYITATPEVVLETRSPSDRTPAVLRKVARWLDAGVSQVWDLNRRRKTLTVYRQDGSSEVLHEGDTLHGEGTLLGMAIPLADVFRTGPHGGP